MQVNRSVKKILFLSLLLITITGGSLSAQFNNKTIQAVPVSEAPKVDGKLDETIWKRIAPADSFFQFDPVNGVKASEKTLVWVSYDKKNVYFAFLMKDSQPNKIWAELTPRNRFHRNDSITVILDTYNDQRTSMRFTVNPRGVQKNSTETIWKSAAALRPDGWAAEIAIPFKSLRFSPEKKQTWGVNFQRYINRLNETNFWTDVDRNKPRLQQMGKLEGLKDIKPSYNIELFPYIGGRFTRWDGETDNKAAVGLDVKYGILPNMTLDMTASPDFSEVESDPFIYQLSPYENYLDENRPFFLEGRQYFGGRRSRFRPSRFDLFYSRRIRSPKFAAKLTGKTNGFSYGVLGAWNKDDDIGDHLFSVVRMQKDVFSNSQIGFYYAGFDKTGDFNRNLGLDYNFVIKNIYFIKGQSAFSFNKNTGTAQTGMHVFEFEREPDTGLQLGLYFKRVEKNVNVRTGFVTQTDNQKTELETGYAWRFKKGNIKRISTHMFAELGHDCSGNHTKSKLTMFTDIDFFSQFGFFIVAEAGKSKYQLYDDADELFWTPGFINIYGGEINFFWRKGGFLKDIDFEAGWRHKGIYNDEFTAIEPGKELNIELSVTLRPKSNLEFSVGGEWIKQVLDHSGKTAFNGITYKTHLHMQFSRHLFARTLLMGETRDGQYNLDLLLGYYFGAGNVVQLSYKKSSLMGDLRMESGHSITLKVSYLFRI